MSSDHSGERVLTYQQYREEAVDFVLYTMANLDLGPPSAEGKPGENDPTCRTGAFCYGATLACRPLVEEYMADEPVELQTIFDRTFRLSFHFSAGVPLIQSMYQARIARLLAEKYGEPQLTDAAERAVFNPATAIPPAQHVQGRDMYRAAHRAPAIWQFYMDILKSKDRLAELHPLDKMRQEQIGVLETFGNKDMYALGLPYFLLKRELIYVEEGRPNAHEFKKYRSDVAEHALKGKPIGNPEFNLIFSELGIALHALNKLATAGLPDFFLITETKKNLDKLIRLTKLKAVQANIDQIT